MEERIQTICNRIMSHRVLCLRPDQTIRNAYDAMIEHEIRHIPIVEEGGVLVGVVSSGDVLLACRRMGGLTVVPEDPISQIMTKNPITCFRNDSIGHLAEAMIRHKVNSLPVLDSEKAVVGIVTSTDLLEVMKTIASRKSLRDTPFLAISI